MRRILALLFLYGCVELVLLLMLADRTSWKTPVLLILTTAFVGAAITRFVKDFFGQAIVARLKARQFPGRELSDGTLIYIAGVLLMLPGILSDLAGILLLLPPVRWLIVWAIRRRYQTFSKGLGDEPLDGPSEEPPAQCKVIVIGGDHVHPVD